MVTGAFETEGPLLVGYLCKLRAVKQLLAEQFGFDPLDIKGIDAWPTQELFRSRLQHPAAIEGAPAIQVLQQGRCRRWRVTLIVFSVGAGALSNFSGLNTAYNVDYGPLRLSLKRVASSCLSLSKLYSPGQLGPVGQPRSAVNWPDTVRWDFKFL